MREPSPVATAETAVTLLEAKPVLRLVHHMARSGGTLISKCIACMQGVMLLSEIHPLGTRQFNPIAQARRWFELFSQADMAGFARAGPIDFAEAILAIQARAAGRGAALVIRDWSHLDFTGVPFVSRPAYRLLTAEALRERGALRQLCTVRHPIDQWLSLSKLALIQGRLSLPQFLFGYRRFAETAADIGFVRYEDFTREPAVVMAGICAQLDLPLDAGFVEKWRYYDRITGDTGAGRGGDEIRPVARRPVQQPLLGAFEASADYRKALDLLGYDHPG